MIIEESLLNKRVFNHVKVISTEVEAVILRHQTPWLKKWTCHKVEVDSEKVDFVSREISDNLDREHSWYADFDNGELHYIIFLNRIFKIDMKKQEQYEEAKNYGISLGIPSYQVDFRPKDRNKE